MKITLELPDDLIRRMRMRAVQRNEKLNKTVAKLVEAGLAAAQAGAPHTHVPNPVRLKGRGPLTIEDIEMAIAGGRAH